MAKHSCLTDRPQEKGSSQSSAPAGRVGRAFGALTEAPSKKAEVSSAAAAAAAPAGGYAACVGASTKAAKSEPTEASKTKGKGKDKGHHRERRGHGSTASPSATQNPKGKVKGCLLYTSDAADE